MTVIREVLKVCQLIKRCDGHGGDVKVFGRYDGYQGGVKGIRKVCQLMQRCGGYGWM